jgi:hypothetical protein
MYRRVNLDPDQLEWIVREVVRRLQEDSVRSAPTREEGPGDGGAAPIDSHVVLTQTLITTATLEHNLQGVARLSVPARAVVTPSARDLLKEHNIELARTT